MTSITYVPMSLCPLTVTIHLILPESQTSSIDFVSLTEVKSRFKTFKYVGGVFSLTAFDIRMRILLRIMEAFILRTWNRTVLSFHVVLKMLPEMFMATSLGKL